jgi:hypothetical protein
MQDTFLHMEIKVDSYIYPKVLLWERNASGLYAPLPPAENLGYQIMIKKEWGTLPCRYRCSLFTDF